MHTLQTNPQQFVYQATMPLPHTLDEYRMHTSYAKDSSFAAKAVRPALIIAFAVGAVLVGMHYYNSANDAAKTDTSPTSTELRTPAMPSAPATRSLPMPAEEHIAKAPAVIEPSKPAEVNSAPLAAPGKNASSESTKPVKAKSSVAAKVPATTAKKIEPIPVVTPLEPVPPQQDVAPAPPPVPAPVPVVDPPQPTPAPVVPPVEPTKL